MDKNNTQVIAIKNVSITNEDGSLELQASSNIHFGEYGEYTIKAHFIRTVLTNKACKLAIRTFLTFSENTLYIRMNFNIARITINTLQKLAIPSVEETPLLKFIDLILDELPMANHHGISWMFDHLEQVELIRDPFTRMYCLLNRSTLKLVECHRFGGIDFNWEWNEKRFECMNSSVLIKHYEDTIIAYYLRPFKKTKIKRNAITNTLVTG